MNRPTHELVHQWRLFDLAAALGYEETARARREWTDALTTDEMERLDRELRAREEEHAYA